MGDCKLKFPEIKPSELALKQVDELFELITTGLQCKEDGEALMRSLLMHNMASANSVLCLLYDVWCYKVGETCFVEQVNPESFDKWFISIPVGWFKDVEMDTEAFTSLYASQADAEDAAVKEFKLIDYFFGKPLVAEETT